MARAIRKGGISFGPVSIKVALHRAQSSGELSFHPFDRRELNPVGYSAAGRRRAR